MDGLRFQIWGGCDCGLCISGGGVVIVIWRYGFGGGVDCERVGIVTGNVGWGECGRGDWDCV